MKHNFIDTGQTLLGLISEGVGIAATALLQSGVSQTKVRHVLQAITGQELPLELVHQYKQQQLFELKILGVAECRYDSRPGSTPVGAFHVRVASLKEKTPLRNSYSRSATPDSLWY